jgi:hypothetical protein
MATVLDENTTEEKRSVVRFLWAKGLNAKDIHKEMFPFYGGKCLPLFTTGTRNTLKELSKSHR